MDTICSCTRVNNLHYRSPRNTIIYNLVREGDGEYGIECYIKGQTKTDYCLCGTFPMTELQQRKFLSC